MGLKRASEINVNNIRLDKKCNAKEYTLRVLTLKTVTLNAKNKRLKLVSQN